MGIILAPISLILFFIIFIIDSIFSFFFETRDRKWFKIVSERMYRKAKLVDIFGNYLFPEFWTWLFSKKDKGYNFGVLGETISSATGRKKEDKSLNYIGLTLYYILYAIDFPSWKYGGHCKRYIMSEEQIKNFK